MPSPNIATLLVMARNMSRRNRMHPERPFSNHQVLFFQVTLRPLRALFLKATSSVKRVSHLSILRRHHHRVKRSVPRSGRYSRRGLTLAQRPVLQAVGLGLLQQRSLTVEIF